MNCSLDDSVLISVDEFIMDVPSLTLMQVAAGYGIQMPRFCYHERLNIAGNCRICLMEEEAEDKMLLACSTVVEDGDIFFITTDKILSARESVLEYLLVNHPLDCPICDQGGECDPQDQSLIFGADRGRFYEISKRAVESKEYSSFIKFFLNRCIHCSRRVRFFSDITGTNSLFLIGRGYFSEIGLYTNPNYILDIFSGSVIDLCPVGALTSKITAYTLRLWEVMDIKDFDIFDCLCSPIRIEMRGSSIMRVLPSSGAYFVENWISDKVRFNFDGYLRQRLIWPYVVYKGRLFYRSWVCCIFYYKKYLSEGWRFPTWQYINGMDWRFTWGRFQFLEDTFIMRQFNCIIGNTPWARNPDLRLASDVASRSFYSSSGFGLTESVLLLGTNIRIECPSMYIQIKEKFSWIEFGEVALIGGFSSDFSECYAGGATFFNLEKVLSFFFDLPYNCCVIIGGFISRYSSWIWGFTRFLESFFEEKVPVVNIFSSISAVNFCELNLFNGYFPVTFVRNYVDTFDINVDNDELVDRFDLYQRSIYPLRVFIGSHGDYGSTRAELVFPVKIFLERPHSSLNIMSVLQSNTVNTFSYYVDRGLRTFMSFMGWNRFVFFGPFRRFVGRKKISRLIKKKRISRLYSMIGRISPVFLGDIYERKFWPDFDLYNVNINLQKFLYNNSLLKNFSLDFFLTDHFSKSSLTLILNNHKSPTLTDFYFINNDFF